MIERRISHEAGRLIDLDEPRLRLPVQKYVDSEHLEAQLVLEILGFGCPLSVSDVVMARDNGLDGHFFQQLPALLA